MANEVALRNRTAAVAKYDVNNNPFLDAGHTGDYFGKRLSLNGNTGKIHIGPQDDEEYLDENTALVADLFSAEMGHVCWVDEEVVEELMFPIISGKKLPIIKDLPDHGPYQKTDEGEDGWRVQYRFKCYDEKTGEQYTFSTISASGVRGTKKLIEAYGKKFAIKIGADGVYQYPVIDFGIVGFKIKDKPKLGTKYAPDFLIIDWVDASVAAPNFGDADNPDDYDNDEEDGEVETVKERAAPARVRAAEPEDETPAPTRGRGRAAAAEPEDEAPAPTRRGRAAAPADDAPPARGRGRAAAAAPEPEPEEDEAPAPARGGRTTSVRHAAPQDADDNVDDGVETRRASARATRGRR